MKLKRELNLIDVFCVASGAMISSGLFILPALAYRNVGSAVVISYLAAGLLATTGMLSQAELVSAMPRAGGTYFYVTRSMGPAVGTVDGLITWFSLSLKSAFALVGMAAFTRILIGVDVRIIGAAFCVVFIVINLLGIKGAGRTQVALVAGLLAVLLFYIFRGAAEIRVENFEPLIHKGKGAAAILSTAGLVFISFGGLLKVASIAEEVKNPARAVPLGMILSLVVVGILYLLVIFVTVGVLGRGGMELSADTLTPISDGAAAFMGRGGRIVLGIAAILAFVSTANAGIMAASRYPMALARDGLLPRALERVNERFKTPHISILITGGFMIAALFLKLRILVEVASTVLILTFMFSCLCVIILRESHVQNYQPRVRLPFYPWVQVIGIIGFGLLLFEMGKEAFLISLVLIAGGLFVYWFYGRIRATREYALLYLIERITAKELTSRSLETELKEIIRQRDEIVQDRFDSVIEESAVLDIEKGVVLSEFFEMAAREISGKVDTAPEVILEKLVQREKESTTAISPALAIPHIIIEGEHKFDILLARCRQGILFSEDAPKVQAVFVLAGTIDERNFHLRALASIAQIVQDPHFEKRWMAAKDEEGLRDVVLLGKRRRH